MDSAPVTHLLWTGGWDSTYRLLDLVLAQRRAVQPYYVVDRGRRSHATELATMDRIRDAAAALQPAAGELILPTRVFAAEEIQPDPDITARFGRLRAAAPLGTQYDWLSRLAKQLDLRRLELSIHRDDKAHEHLAGHVAKDADGYVLAPDPANEDLEIFRRFGFPIFDLAKVDMRSAAAANGFLDLMHLTWFCFRPDRHGRPCGRCAPCRFTIDEGMAYRIPWQGRWQGRLITAVRRRLPPSVERLAKAALGRA
jgi:hypothetical protein